MTEEATGWGGSLWAAADPDALRRLMGHLVIAGVLFMRKARATA
jgi:hypothetical protein